MVWIVCAIVLDAMLIIVNISLSILNINKYNFCLYFALIETVILCILAAVWMEQPRNNPDRNLNRRLIAWIRRSIARVRSDESPRVKFLQKSIIADEEELCENEKGNALD